MAAGFLVAILGIWILLRTVAPGQSRSLVDAILGGRQSDAGASPAGQPAAGAPSPASDAAPITAPAYPTTAAGARRRAGRSGPYATG